MLTRPSPAAPQYNVHFDAVISIDVGGMVEYWSPDAPFEKPDSVEWQTKAATDLYQFKKVRSGLDSTHDCLC